MHIGIVITGIICDYYLENLINQYKNCDYTKIVSTWDYTDTDIIDKLLNNGFFVILNKFPSNIYPSSVNYQNYSAVMGIRCAEKLNVTHVIRLRADMYCNNITNLLEIYKNIYKEDKLIFLLHFHNTNPGYLVDYVYFGKINDTLLYIKNFQLENDSRFPEKFLQETCYGTNDFNIINKHVIYSGEILLKNNIDFHFLTYAHSNCRKDLINSLIEFNTENGFYSF